MKSESLTVEAREEKRKSIQKDIISTGEALEILDISRVRLHQLMERGLLEQVGYGVYLKADIVAYKKAFDEARSNNKWLRDFK